MNDKRKVDLPREKLISYGMDSLSTAEILAVILGSGSQDENVVELSQRILNEYETLDELFSSSYEELKKYKGIGEAKALKLVCAFELNSRYVNEKYQDKKIIKTPKDIYNIMSTKCNGLTQEHIYCIYLNIKYEIIKIDLISIGTLSQTIMHPRDIFKRVYRYSANSFILIHNHPSGNTIPSDSDIQTTKKIKEISDFLDVEFDDHIIMGKNSYFSFKENFTNIF